MWRWTSASVFYCAHWRSLIFSWCMKPLIWGHGSVESNVEFQWHIRSGRWTPPQSRLLPRRAGALKLPLERTRSRWSTMPKRDRNRNFPAFFASGTSKSVCFPACDFPFPGFDDAQHRPWWKFLRPFRRQARRKKYVHTPCAFIRRQSGTHRCLIPSLSCSSRRAASIFPLWTLVALAETVAWWFEEEGRPEASGDDVTREKNTSCEFRLSPPILGEQLLFVLGATFAAMVLSIYHWKGIRLLPICHWNVFASNGAKKLLWKCSGSANGIQHNCHARHQPLSRVRCVIPYLLRFSDI